MMQCKIDDTLLPFSDSSSIVRVFVTVYHTLCNVFVLITNQIVHHLYQQKVTGQVAKR